MKYGVPGRVGRVIMEGWMWLEREGFIAPKPGQQHDWVFITRLGPADEDPDWSPIGRRASAARVTPSSPHHKAAGLFRRGDYDTAVFQAFKGVEIAVRARGQFAATDVGVNLMRAAFNPTTAPLQNPADPVPEREALMHLFAGAIGRYKNPYSHRNVPIDPAEGIELLLLASHLLRIVDTR